MFNNAKKSEQHTQAINPATTCSSGEQVNTTEEWELVHEQLARSLALLSGSSGTMGGPGSYHTTLSSLSTAALSSLPSTTTRASLQAQPGAGWAQPQGFTQLYCLAHLAVVSGGICQPGALTSGAAR
eukprot:gene9236-16386_t